MASTDIALNVRGVNKTGTVFSQIRNSIRSIGAAFAAFAAIKAVTNTINELGKLSDVAMRASSSVKEVTQLSQALGMLGVKGAEVENLATAFQKMAKETGKTGLSGFKEVVMDIAKLGSLEERSAQAMKVFGRAGLNFMPIIEAASKNGIDALEAVIAAMPGISDAAAEAGDGAADAMGIATNSIKSLWSDAIAGMIRRYTDGFSGGIREQTSVAMAHFIFNIKKGWRYFETWVFNLTAGITYFFNNFKDISVQIWEYTKKQYGLIFDYLKAGFSGMWEVVKELGNQSVVALKGGKADWSQAWAKGIDIPDWDSRFIKEAMENFSNFHVFPEGLFKEYDISDLEEALRKAIASAKGLDANAANAAISSATGEVVEKFDMKEFLQKPGSFTEKAAKAIKDATNAFVEGGSYEAATAGLRRNLRREDEMVKNTKKMVITLDEIKDLSRNMVENLGPVGVLA